MTNINHIYGKLNHIFYREIYQGLYEALKLNPNDNNISFQATGASTKLPPQIMASIISLSH